MAQRRLVRGIGHCQFIPGLQLQGKEKIPMVIELRKATRDDLEEYNTWFSDKDMDYHLGPKWSDKEIDEILRDRSGSVWSAMVENCLVAVVGLVYPDHTHDDHGITNLAVHPEWRRCGIGGKTLEALLRQYKSSQALSWIAFVHVSNPNAQTFLEKHGWDKGDIENNMYRFTLLQ